MDSSSRAPRPLDGDETSVPGLVNRGPLVERLAVDAVSGDRGRDRYIGSPIYGFNQRPFGGHLLAQALRAAAETVERARVVTSLHANFLRIGTHAHPFEYTVERVRDGRTYSNRSVRIVQEDRELARVTISFSIRPALGMDSGFALAVSAPAVPGPDELPPMHRRHEDGLPFDGIRIPVGANWRTASRPLDVRYVDDDDMVDGIDRCFWFRAEPVPGASQNTERAILTFASDRSLLPVIGMSRVKAGQSSGFQVTSLDHAIWFHEDVTAGEWYLYVQNTPFNSETAGLATGSVFSQEGNLVASIAQFGLVTHSFVSAGRKKTG